MALVVGQNSWASVVEADAYLNDRINAQDWFVLEDEGTEGQITKGSLLISSFYWLITSQQLNLTPNLTSDSVKNAQIESGLFLLEHYKSLNQRRAAMFTGVESFKLSQKSEKLNLTKLQIPDHILGGLVEYIISNTFAELKGQYDN